MKFKPVTPSSGDVHYVQIRMLDANFEELERVCKLRNITKHNFITQAIRYAIDNLDPLE